MEKFTVIFIATFYLFSMNAQTVNGGHAYSEDLQIHIENIRNIYSSNVPFTHKDSTNNDAHMAIACHKDFCCQFNIEYENQYNPQNLSFLEYSLFAYKGSATFSDTVQNTVEICGITKVNHEHSEKINNVKAIGISGILESVNSTIYPFVQKTNQNELTNYRGLEENLKYNLDNDKMTFEFLVEDNQNYFETIFILSTNLQMERFRNEESSTVNVVLDSEDDLNKINLEEESLTDYLYTRFKIIAFIVTIYCLEQM